jgi:hypothetical protein
MPRYVTIDLFGKVQVGKTTIFELFAGKRFLHEGGNLSYDFRTYYAKCWVMQNRWTHSMVFLADPKYDMRWKQLDFKFLKKKFEPTNILMIVTDSTEADVLAVKNSFTMYPRLKRKLILFVIANMQDLLDRLSVDKIQDILGLKEVLGLSAIQEGAKEKVEKFLEEATLRYFLMLSKRGDNIELVDEIGLLKSKEERNKPEPKKKKTKYGDRLKRKANPASKDIGADK